MKQITFCTIAIALILTSCAGGGSKRIMRIDPSKLVSHDGQKYYFDDKPFSGISESHYPNGRIQKLLHYRSGWIEGVSTEWRDDGTRSSRAVWLKGQMHGPYNSWYRNGKQKLECTFVSMRREGWARQWYENGQMMYEAFYESSKQPRLMRKWAKDGVRKKELEFFSQGIPEGEFKWWHPNGQKMLLGIMEDGELKRLKYWSTDGKTHKRLWPEQPLEE